MIKGKKKMPATHASPAIDGAIQAAMDRLKEAEGLGAQEWVRAVTRLRQEIILSIAEKGAIGPGGAKALKAEIGNITGTYNGKFQSILSENQRRLFTRGIQVVDRALEAGKVEAAVPYLDESILQKAREFGAELVTDLTDYARKQVTKQIDLAVLGQKGLEDTIRGIAGAVGKPSVFGSIEKRAEVIYTTEVNRIANQATQMRLEQIESQVPDLGKKWLHSHVGIPRVGHLLLDGTVVKAKGTFELKGRDGNVYTIGGPHDPSLPVGEVAGCFIGEMETDASDIELAYRSHFSGELVTIRTSSGHEVTGTPNHPVLTPGGFRPLGRFKKGDRLFSCPPGKNIFVGQPDVEDVPSSLQEIFDSFSCHGSGERMSGSGVNFYGDRPDGDVDVVRPYAFLKDHAEASLGKPFGKEQLTGPDAGEGPLSQAGLPLEDGVVLGHAPDFCMGGAREAETALDGEAGHSEMRGGASSPDGDPGEDQVGADGPPGKAELTSELELRFSLDVLFDEIVSTSTRKVDAFQVYTLQTVSGIYNCNGIIASNCKCQIVPVVMSKAKDKKIQAEGVALVQAKKPLQEKPIQKPIETKPKQQQEIAKKLLASPENPLPVVKTPDLVAEFRELNVTQQKAIAKGKPTQFVSLSSLASDQADLKFDTLEYFAENPPDLFLKPVTVVELPGGKKILIDGNSRAAWALAAGLTEIPAKIVKPSDWQSPAKTRWRPSSRA